MTPLAEPNKTTFEALAEIAKDIGFGEWDVKLIIHEGRIVGFDHIPHKPPVQKFRETHFGKKKQ